MFSLHKDIIPIIPIPYLAIDEYVEICYIGYLSHTIT